jgi:hypothetical protein
LQLETNVDHADHCAVDGCIVSRIGQGEGHLTGINECLQAISIATKQEISANEKAGAVAEEVLAGVRTVTAFNAQYFEVTRY